MDNSTDNTSNNTSDNPLLQSQGLPQFSRLQVEHIVPAMEHILTANRQAISDLLAANDVYSWDNLVEPLEELEDRLNRAWSPVSHLNSVMNSDELRTAYDTCLPLLSEYSTELGQHQGLYQAFKQLASSDAYASYDVAQKKVIDNALRDFTLSGIGLEGEAKERYKAIKQELTKLSSKFEQNLLDATHGWFYEVTDKAKLTGLPESAVAMAKATAERERPEECLERDQNYWLFSLEFPSYFAVMSYADDRTMREAMYQAYVTRASEQGPNAGKWDNSGIMHDLVQLRDELSKLLGFSSYAERSLATKMAETPEQVLEFLTDLASRSKVIAEDEFNELKTFAQSELGLDDAKPWDLLYAGEKLREHRYSLSQEALKPYFPAQQVIAGMFGVVNRLYGITISEVAGVETWHPDVQFFEIKDGNGQIRGQFYLDLYARPHKRGGAWMDECVGRRAKSGVVQIPVAYLTCNFTPPVEGQPTLLKHDEVITLFHEFGHGLHHMLTQVDYISVSGISGVPWDAVELPSQFLENWCWEREALNLFASHYETGDKIPDSIYEKMIAARNFQSGMQMVRQLEFSLFDFKLHMQSDYSDATIVQKVLDQVRSEVTVVPIVDYNRFQHSFAHIFAGGYAAGYYSYKWAEVLSADAFSKFEEDGIFDPETGSLFLRTVLENGGAEDPMDLFVAFRGRKPTIDALLRHTGIAA